MIRVFLVVLATAIGGCAVQPGAPLTGPNDTQITGRVSLTHDGRRDAGGFTYRSAGARQSWILFGPTGTAVGELSSGPRGARWQPTDGDALAAADIDALVETALGVAAPLASARDWIWGRIPPGAHARDGGFSLDGWRLEWLKYTADGVPRLMRLTRGDTELRLVAKTWQ